MGLFNTIKEKLGFDAVSNDAQVKAPEDKTADVRTSNVDGMDLPEGKPTTTSNATTGPHKELNGESASATAAVDVPAKLDGMASQHPETLNWRTSIVDLLKLLGIDSSLGSRKELATELGCPADKMADSAAMNIWLHKAVMRKLAENGGQVPAELTD